MAVLHQDTDVVEGPRFCPECGHPCAGVRYCPECGRQVTQLASGGEQPTAEMPPPAFDSPPAPPAGAAAGAEGKGGRPRSRVVLIAAAGALVLAVVAVLVIVLANNSGSGSPVSHPAAYRTQLGSAFAPVITANQKLSVSLQALDGSKRTVAAAQSATTQASSAVTAARGAISVLGVPDVDQTLSQQAQQALTEEDGYLQALSSTLANPAGQSSSQLRPLITSAQSAMVPLASVAPGATGSLTGIDNVLSWAGGAAAVKHNAQHKAQQQAQQQQQQQQQQQSAPPQQSPPPAASPSPAPPGLTACDQNISVNSQTSCSFADAVFNQYAQDVQSGGGPGSYSVFATSPDTGQSYTDNCNYNPTTQIVLCSHGSDLIQFPYWAASVYVTH